MISNLSPDVIPQRPGKGSIWAVHLTPQTGVLKIYNKVQMEIFQTIQLLLFNCGQ